MWTGAIWAAFASDIEDIMKSMKRHLPKATTLELRGQAETMQASFVRLGIGIIFAVILVYLLMVVNFQSWVDPFIILMALPGAFAGVLWMLFITQTTFSVPSLMGSIMAIGVATANSILMVTFANDERAGGQGRARSGSIGRSHAPAPGLHDCARHGARHAAHGARARRRRRAECSAGPRRDRRPADCDVLDSVCRAHLYSFCARKPRSITTSASTRKSMKARKKRITAVNPRRSRLNHGESRLEVHCRSRRASVVGSAGSRPAARGDRRAKEAVGGGADKNKEKHDPKSPSSKALWIIAAILVAIF